MPVLRSAKSKRLFPPLTSEPSVRSMQSSFRSMHSLSVRSNFSKTNVKLEPVSPSPSNTDLNDIRQVLQSSSSEARFYSEVCEDELKKLMKERELINNKIQGMVDSNKGKDGKDVEAAKLVKKLWEEANKKCEITKQGRFKGKCMRRLGPIEVKRIFEEAKKLSNHSKLRRKLLVARKQRVESKIHLAIETVKFCRKYINGN